MKLVLDRAKKAYLEDEIPIACLIARGDEIIAIEHNTKEKDNNPLKHAEIKCIDKALKKIGSKYLNDCEIYVNIEPCMMCMGAIINTRIKKIYISSLNPKGGFFMSNYEIMKSKSVNHRLEYEIGLLEVESKKLIQDFFLTKRKNNKV